MEEAREAYFAAGGLESDIGPRESADWYWRRTVKIYRSRAERVPAMTEMCTKLMRLAEANRWRCIEVMMLADGRCELRASTPDGYTAASVRCDLDTASGEVTPDEALATLAAWVPR